MEKIKFAIIGTGDITKRFIRGVELVENAEVVAVCSRNLQKAEAYAASYGIRAYGDFDVCLQDDNIDAVYIATPNQTHVTYVMKALHARKHVLCEKIMMLHSEEVKEAFALARQQGVMLMEAMKACFLPTTRKAKDWIEAGKIGNIRLIQAQYCANSMAHFREGYRSQLTSGGGALFDLGVYPLAFLLRIYPHPIVDIQTQMRKSETGIDTMSAIQLRYDDGVIARILCAVDMADINMASIIGEQGVIRIQDFWKSEQASCVAPVNEEFEEIHNRSEFRYQVQAFVNDIITNQTEDAIMNEDASLRCIEIIEEIWRKENL